MTISSAVPIARETVDTAFLVNQAVLFDETDGTVLELNPPASAVWMLIDGETSIEQIVIELSELFDLPPEQLRPDCQQIVADFAAKGLVTHDRAGAAPISDEGEIPAITDVDERPRTTEVLHPPLEP